MIRRLLPLVGVLIALSSTGARAQGDPLTVTGVDRRTGSTCWTGTMPNLNYDWGGGPVGDCPGDLVQLTITGQIFLDAGETLFVASDDGVRVWIDDELYVDAWYPRPCSGNVFTGPETVGWHTIRVDFFEDYGGACLHLWHMTQNGWQIVPAGLFAGNPPSTTTTEEPTTSTSSTTTSTTSTTTISTTVPETTTTQSLPEPPSQATTSTQAIQTTTSQPIQIAASTTSAAQIAPSPTSIQPPSTASIVPETTSLPITTIAATTTNVNTTSTTSTVLETRITPAEALETVLDAGKVAALTPTEAAEVFAAVDESQLTPEQGLLLVAAVQDAPVKVREAFEAQINVFGGATDTYVPIGSTIPVKARRVIIIVSGLLVAMPAPRRSRR